MIEEKNLDEQPEENISPEQNIISITEEQSFFSGAIFIGMTLGNYRRGLETKSYADGLIELLKQEYKIK